METHQADQKTSSQRQQAATSSKAFVLKSSTKTNLNLYDHLAHLLTKVMDGRPQNAVDVIEDLSFRVKRELVVDLLLAEQQRGLFSQVDEGDPDDELIESPLPNVNETSYYLELLPDVARGENGFDTPACVKLKARLGNISGNRCCQ